MEIGDIVRSKAGHDRGQIFVVVQLLDGYAHIVNGKTKKLCNPKRKKWKHVETVEAKNCEIVNMIETNRLTDKQIRKVIHSLLK